MFLSKEVKQMKKNSFLFLLISSFIFGDTCSSVSPSLANKIAKNTEKLKEIVAEMKEIDEILDDSVEKINNLLKSSGMEMGSINGIGTFSSTPREDSQKVMNAERIIAKSRLNYLKASISRLQFQFALDMEKSLNEYDSKNTQGARR